MDFKRFPGLFVAEIPTHFATYAETKRQDEPRFHGSDFRESAEGRAESALRPVWMLNKLVALQWPGRSAAELQEMAARMQGMRDDQALIDSLNRDCPLLPSTLEDGSAVRCALRVEGANLKLNVDNQEVPTQVTNTVVRQAYLLLVVLNQSGVRREYPFASYDIREMTGEDLRGENDSLVPGFTFAKPPGSPQIWEGNPIAIGSEEHASLEQVLTEAIICSTAMV